MKDIIANILIDEIGRENVSRFIKDENGDFVVTVTISLATLAEEIADTLKKQGYGDTKQAVREFAERLKERIYKAENPYECLTVEVDSDEIKSMIDELLAEVTGE